MREGAALGGLDDLSPALASADRATADYLDLGALANRLSPGVRHARSLRPARRPGAFPSRLPRAHARRDRRKGYTASPWDRPARGRACGAGRPSSIMQSQVEAGHGCPITMTFAATPSLRSRAGKLAQDWLPKHAFAASMIPRTRRLASDKAGRDDRHGDDGKAGRFGRSRQHHAGDRRSAMACMRSPATSTSSPRQCATRF